jgi:PPOX class probable F420-dependent enzyme
VTLTDDEARRRLAAHDHGVLSTLHPERGIDAVPCVYAVAADGRHLAVPIDRVKPKTTTRLQRTRNLEHDPNATLLIEQWDRDDWSRLWWVRTHLRWDPEPPVELVDALADALAERYHQYEARPFAGLLVFEVVELTGWAATAPG